MSEVNWTMLMLAGPLFLVVGYVAVFWAAWVAWPPVQP